MRHATPGPELGYYYRYQHDSSGAFNNYAYCIYGLGHQPKMIAVQKMRSCRSTGLYTKTAYAPGMAGCSIGDKPAIVNGIEVPRFAKITDPEVIARLAAIKARVYPDAYRTRPAPCRLDRITSHTASDFASLPPTSQPGAASASPRPAPPLYTALHSTGNLCECARGREPVHRQLACWSPAST